MPLNPPDIKELKAIVDWVNLADDVRQLSIKIDGIELFISRDRTAASTSAAPSPSPLTAATPSTAPESSEVPTPSGPAAAAAPAASVSAGSTASALAADEVLIKAPMVGTFYASPKPGDPEFVSVGDSVTASTIVGIVEVMKLMNSLEARVDGTVVRILVENEQAVEYGQPLLVIKRNA